MSFSSIFFIIPFIKVGIHDDWQDWDDDDGLGRWSFSCESILNFHLTTFSRVEVHSKYLNHGMYVINGEHTFDGEEARTKFEGIENM